jgi:acyl-coenzyme A synthetase/AMP-(fatty) acid ligase
MVRTGLPARRQRRRCRLTGLFTPLLQGGQVVLVSEDLGIQGLRTAVKRPQPFSLIKITPSQLQLLAWQLSADEAAGRTQAFIIGGENLLAEHIEFWQKHAPATTLINEYGPTETVVGCCGYQVRGRAPKGVAIPMTADHQYSDLHPRRGLSSRPGGHGRRVVRWRRRSRARVSQPP